MFDFQHRPGLFFVWATLLPLASFVLLLLLGAVRNFARRYRADSAAAAQVFELSGGNAPGKLAFYLATGAIGLAFVLSLVGFVVYLSDHAGEHGGHSHGHAHAAADDHGHVHAHGHAHDAKDEHAKKEQKAEAEAEGHSEEEHNQRWAGAITWAQVLPSYYRENHPEHGTTLKLGFYVDGLTAIMFVMVTFIATLIHIFSSGYMAEELQPVVEDHEVHTEHGHLHRRGRFGRFYLFLSLFCFSMLNLVLADNLFQVFVSWELVGVCSYLLIGFYYERRSASNAANKAFITNRIGDAGFIIGLLIVWTYIGNFNFQEIFERVRAPHEAFETNLQFQYEGRILHGNATAPDEEGRTIRVAAIGAAPTWDSQVVLFPDYENHEKIRSRDFVAARDEAGKRYLRVTVPTQVEEGRFGSMPYWMLVAAGLGIFLGCVGKSAQFPLHVWLPDAMEGPTPVSALIHAATMVAAGVYLVGRCYPLFTPEVLLTIAYIGGITLFVAATIAIVMTDIKKVLAYSTVSQLGYMMLGLGVGGWAAGLFHLITHAFFKALMFLASGSVIYGCHHVQEMTRMGGLYPKMKITALTMLMGVLAIAGIPLFSGWYSKDAILASAMGFANLNPQHYLLFLLPLFTAGITTFYMFRMWFMTFAGPPKDKHVFEHAHESPRVMTTPLIILAVFAVCVAWPRPHVAEEIKGGTEIFGWPLLDAEASWLEGQLHHAQPVGVEADHAAEHRLAEEVHSLAGNLALLSVVIGFSFAYLLYYRRVLDPAEARAQMPGVYNFLQHKWYVDELYSAMVVRPGLAAAGWCRFFDTRVIDGFVNWLGRASVVLSRVGGLFDKSIVDGAVNLVARAWYGIGAGLRRFQTGYLRSYILFLVLAAVGIWVLLTLFAGSGAGAP
ncbi:MAG: NADH-quinone oxidoreductase subunit L [Gemmataceae bacterium]